MDSPDNGQNGKNGITRINGDGRRMSDLFRDLARDTQMLFSQEVRLAKLEIKEGVANAKTGAIFLAAAGAVGLVGLMLVAGTLVALLSLVLQVWAAAMIVTAVFLILAGILALIGKSKLNKANPTPEVTIQTLKEDQEWLKQQIS